MTKATKPIDLSFRPDTYFPESKPREELLSRIKGQSRREIARGILEKEGIAGLNALIARDELTDHDRDMWGRIHPWMMGGEYLPEFKGEEVEIARVSLKSTTFDQKSIRARPEGEHIHLSVEDEYETEYELPVATINKPFTLGQMIEFIDGVAHPEDTYGGGLVESNWNFMQSEVAGHPEESVDFASIESAVYPELERYYNEYGDNWINERLVPYMAMLHGVNEDDWPQFMEELSPQWTLGSLSQLSVLEFSILLEKPSLTPRQVKRIRETEYKNWA